MGVLFPDMRTRIPAVIKVGRADETRIIYDIRYRTWIGQVANPGFVIRVLGIGSENNFHD